ncbi:MAG: hypothetical protein FWC43_04250 [Planctomycetaceae bacterium]|nr:hypothetical protein [Planctomycetaceae bacterium]
MRLISFTFLLFVVLPFVPAADESEKPFNPIEKNGEYFVGWPKPKLALVFTGFQEGYLEPCGCAGMQEMKGGLSRRMSFFGTLKEMGWPVVAIDGGDLCNGKADKQAELKFDHTLDAFRMMGYDAVGLGMNDLAFSAQVLLGYTVELSDTKSMFTAANVAPYDFNDAYLAPYKIVEKNGVKLGIVSVITNNRLADIQDQEIARENPVTRLREIIPKLDAAECQYLIMIVHGKRGTVLKETEKILDAFPNKFSIVLVSDPPAEPPRRLPRMIGDCYVIEVGEKGKFAIVLGLFEGENTPPKYQSVALDSRYNNSPVVMKMMKEYQERLKEEGPSGLNLKSYSNPNTALMGKFIGSKECQSCHEPSYDVWKKTRHATAWKSLIETANPPRNYDPDCVGCHVVGWNPQSVYPYIGGFDIGNQEKTRHLTNVGCESCHGPGENHKNAELDSNKTKQAELRQAVRLPLENAQKNCVSCHDGDNSPNFNFETYWSKIKHSESDDEEE